jgi:hypothetical protein
MVDVTANTLNIILKNTIIPGPTHNRFQNCLIWNNGYCKGKPLIMRTSDALWKPENTGKMARLTIMTDTSYTLLGIT